MDIFLHNLYIFLTINGHFSILFKHFCLNTTLLGLLLTILYLKLSYKSKHLIKRFHVYFLYTLSGSLCGVFKF